IEPVPNVTTVSGSPIGSRSFGSTISRLARPEHVRERAGALADLLRVPRIQQLMCRRVPVLPRDGREHLDKPLKPREPEVEAQIHHGALSHNIEIWEPRKRGAIENRVVDVRVEELARFRIGDAFVGEVSSATNRDLAHRIDVGKQTY